MLSLLKSSFAAGTAISIGATAFLLSNNRYIGAVLFAVGLLMIQAFGLRLFTGKVSKALDGGESVARLAVILLGNFSGVFVTALIERTTRLYPALADAARNITGAKSADSPLSLFVLGMFCNVMIYLAVEGDLLALVYGVTVFVLCGFEHCVADFYYYAIAGEILNPPAIVRILTVICGNATGGILWHYLCTKNSAQKTE